MLHRLAVGLRRFFKFSNKKNRLPVEPFAGVVRVQDGKEKKSEQHSEPKGSQIYECEVDESDTVIMNLNGTLIRALKHHLDLSSIIDLGEVSELQEVSAHNLLRQNF